MSAVTSSTSSTTATTAISSSTHPPHSHQPSQTLTTALSLFSFQQLWPSLFYNYFSLFECHTILRTISKQFNHATLNYIQTYYLHMEHEIFKQLIHIQIVREQKWNEKQRIEWYKVYRVNKEEMEIEKKKERLAHQGQQQQQQQTQSDAQSSSSQTQDQFPSSSPVAPPNASEEEKEDEDDELTLSHASTLAIRRECNEYYYNKQIGHAIYPSYLPSSPIIELNGQFKRWLFEEMLPTQFNALCYQLILPLEQLKLYVAQCQHYVMNEGAALCCFIDYKTMNFTHLVNSMLLAHVRTEENPQWMLPNHAIKQSIELQKQLNQQIHQQPNNNEYLKLVVQFLKLLLLSNPILFDNTSFRNGAWKEIECPTSFFLFYTIFKLKYYHHSKLKSPYYSYDSLTDIRDKGDYPPINHDNYALIFEFTQWTMMLYNVYQRMEKYITQIKQICKQQRTNIQSSTDSIHSSPSSSFFSPSSSSRLSILFHLQQHSHEIIKYWHMEEENQFTQQINNNNIHSLPTYVTPFHLHSLRYLYRYSNSFEDDNAISNSRTVLPFLLYCYDHRKQKSFQQYSAAPFTKEYYSNIMETYTPQLLQFIYFAHKEMIALLCGCYRLQSSPTYSSSSSADSSASLSSSAFSSSSSPFPSISPSFLAWMNQVNAASSPLSSSSTTSPQSNDNSVHHSDRWSFQLRRIFNVMINDGYLMPFFNPQVCDILHHAIAIEQKYTENKEKKCVDDQTTCVSESNTTTTSAPSSSSSSNSDTTTSTPSSASCYRRVGRPPSSPFTRFLNNLLSKHNRRLLKHVFGNEYCMRVMILDVNTLFSMPFPKRDKQSYNYDDDDNLSADSTHHLITCSFLPSYQYELIYYLLWHKQTNLIRFIIHTLPSLSYYFSSYITDRVTGLNPLKYIETKLNGVTWKLKELLESINQTQGTHRKHQP